MAVYRQMLVTLAVLCACAATVVGCDSSGAVTTTKSTEAADNLGLYRVSVEGKWGYIDNTGTIKIQPQFELALPFFEGLAVVGLNGKMGYIDTSGTLVIPMQYAMHSDFSDGLCLVMVQEGGNQTWGYIDKTGATVIQPTFDTANDFSEGLAGVAASLDTDSHGYIDKSGDLVITLPKDLRPEWSFEQGGFSEGRAIVQKLALDNSEAPGFRYGYVDTSGQVVIPPEFSQATDFSEGLAAVGVAENGVVKWGYIDKTGAWIVRPQYDKAGPFSEGLAGVALQESDSPETGGSISISGDRWGYIDKTGAVAIAPKYQVAWPFSGGLAWVENWAPAEDPADTERVSSAYIDMTGKVIWQGK
jgi:hypothetical protein